MSKRLPLGSTVDISIQELSDKRQSARSAALSLLTDTKWPPETNAVAQDLLQTINNLPDLPEDIRANPVKDTALEFVRVLEGVPARLKKASEKYGMMERGFWGGIKYDLSSFRRSKCTNKLRTCRDDIEKASANLRDCLKDTPTSGHASTRRVESPETPPELQPQPAMPLVVVDHPSEPSEPSQNLQTTPTQRTIGSQHPTSHPAPLQGHAEDRESRSPIRDQALIAAKKTFETVEAVSGALPVVGSFVGVAAKVGLAFVKAIETMDKNEDVSRELAFHTTKLSSYLEHFKEKFDTEKGDEVATHIEGLRGELECVQEKVKTWDSFGRLKKAFLSSDHAEELKAHHDTVQNALEEMQLLVSLKTTDLVIELRNTELRAERIRLLDRLGDGSYGARGNAVEDVICLPGTRVEILNRISTWIKDTSPSADRVLWIRGMAGRGKSAIASTVAHEWASKGSCAIFHFRRGQNALDSQFVCALARQLGKGLVPEVKNAILNCVKENEDITKERLEQQFKTLFVGSLGKLQGHAYPIVIIVDALDECKSTPDAVRFVRLIDQYSSFLPPNVKFLLTCRPEAPLIVALEPRNWHAEDLDSISHVSQDITRFIKHELTRIRDEHDLPTTWPSSADLDGIVGMAQGLFQWARTAIAYVSDGSPSIRLRELLQHPSEWGGLDELYQQILLRAFDKVETNWMRKQMLSWVLETLVVAPHPVTLEVIAFLHADHRIFVGQENVIQLLLDIVADLNSLLHIPTSSSEPVRLMHTSIRDLLTAKERCQSQRYFVNPIEGHFRLASVGLRIMGRDLRQNNCNLPGLPKPNSEVQDAIDIHVANGLRYCCRSWSTHLTAGVQWSEATSDARSAVLAKFNHVSEEKLLPWLEVMSLIGAMNEAYIMAKHVHQWLLEWPQDISNSSLNTLWNDTQRFIAAFFKEISCSALEIYASALPRCPVKTKLCLTYGVQATAWDLVGEREQNWSANIWTADAGSGVGTLAFSPDGSILISGSSDGSIRLWDAQTGALLGDPLTGPSDGVISVVFLPDGKILASGPWDKTVQLWDAQTGALLGDPLTGHRDWITSLVFSPDGKILASGSHDKTVRLWDAQTGALLGDPLTGHSGPIMSVVFSPDSKILASGSQDNTVRLWDVQTGALLGDPLTGHRDSVTSVVFSPDGKILVSGSGDNTVRLWDAQTGALLGDPLTGHSDSITSVVFSPDGKILASGSEDESVRLWDAQTGALLGDPLTGHSLLITSVVFSPDGKILASGSYDMTVQLWDVHTRALLGDPLTGHSDMITSAMFSPDGKVLASGSCDKTVRLWDGQSGALLGDPLTGHNGWIMSVVFSPDGTILASGSRDKTVRLWDAQTGALLGDPLTGHSHPITSIVFSPDGKILASGSDDETVQLWDAQTGALVGDPLTGHSDSITSVVFSPDGKILASGSDDKTVQLWDAQTGALVGDPLNGHSRSITSVVFSPNGKILASGSNDKTVRLWDAQTGALLGDPLTGHSHSITSIVFSPDGKILASGSGDNTVRLWDAQTGALLGEPLTGHSLSITSVAFSPDGKTVTSVSAEGKVRIWDLSLIKYRPA